MPAGADARVPLIEWLGEAVGDASSLGGKAASLDRLIRLGFPVPPAFCVTVAAFRAQLDALPAVPHGRSKELVGAQELRRGDELGRAVAGAALSPPLLAALQTALARLDALSRASGWATRLAVRSSALGEDGSAASYAGLHETELDRTIAEVPDAIRRCWASLWSAPALAYRARRGLAIDDAAMAVVVQQLVPADAAAVVFTRHPVTGSTDQVVVTAVRGLGEAMVSGLVTPDTFVVARADPARVEVTRGEGPEQSIDGDELAEIVRMCLAVEVEYGAPVDVEAARADGRWYLLQARPITAAGEPALAGRGA